MGARRVYRRTTPYPAAALEGLDHTQSADLLYTVHISYPVQKLERYGNTDWRWKAVVFGPTVNPPSGMTASATIANSVEIHTQNYFYVITGLTKGSPVQETRASSIFSIGNDLSLAGNYNTINLPALGVFDRYVIYKKQAGVYGYIGSTTELTFRDENIQPALSESPPEGYNPFVGAGNYPSSITLHQQRLTFGGTATVINGVYASRSADFENMDKARPVRADDSLLFSLVSERVNAITHITSLKELMVFTGEAVWSVNGGGDGAALTASAIVPSRESGRGAARVKPLVVDNTIFYPTNKGNTLRALGFSFEDDGYKTDNVSIFAPHLFNRARIKKTAYQEEPFACVWTLRYDGVLLCLTWEQEQDVWGWSPMTIDGFVEDICTIGEKGFDRLYIIVRRTIGAVEYRFLERMALPGVDAAGSVHLDCSITQTFTVPSATLTGLWHLEGQTVSASYAVAGDLESYAEHNLVVTGGTITITTAATTITAGLRYEGTIETLPASLNSSSGSIHTDRQQITEVVARTLNTKGISVGVNATTPEVVDPVFNEEENTHDHKVQVPGDWNDTSTVVIKQTEPMPAHIVGIFVGMNVNP